MEPGNSSRQAPEAVLHQLVELMAPERRAQAQPLVAILVELLRTPSPQVQEGGRGPTSQGDSLQTRAPSTSAASGPSSKPGPPRRKKMSTREPQVSAGEAAALKAAMKTPLPESEAESEKTITAAPGAAVTTTAAVTKAASQGSSVPWSTVAIEEGAVTRPSAPSPTPPSSQRTVVSRSTTVADPRLTPGPGAGPAQGSAHGPPATRKGGPAHSEAPASPSDEGSDEEGFKRPKKPHSKRTAQRPEYPELPASKKIHQLDLANRFAQLPCDPDVPQPQPSTSAASVAPTSADKKGPEKKPGHRRMPGITVQAKERWPELAKDLTKEGVSFSRADNRFDGIHVKPATATDHRRIAAALEERKIDHHVYRLPEDKPLRVVIRGLPTDFKIQDIREELQERGFPVLEAVRIRLGGGDQRRDSPLVYVQLVKSPKGLEIYQLRELCYVHVSVEAKRKPQQQVRQ